MGSARDAPARRLRETATAGAAAVVDYAQGPRVAKRIRLHRFTGRYTQAAPAGAAGPVVPRT